MQTFCIHTTAHAAVEECLLTISNNSTDPTQEFKIVRLDLDPFYPATGAFGKINLVRVSSPTLLESDTNDRITPAKNSAATSSLPSQVVISRNAALAGTQSIFRSYLPSPYLGTQGTTNALGLKGLGNFNAIGYPGSGSVCWNGRGGSVIQSIVVRDGESMMLVAANNTISIYPHTYFFKATVKVASGGTFTIMDEFTPSRGAGGSSTDSGFVIHNGSGSGVDLEISNIEIYDMGQSSIAASTDMPQIRIVKSDSIYGSGQTITPAQHDTRYPIPAQLTVRRNTRESPLTVNPISKTGFNIYMDFGFPNTTANYPTVRKINTFRTIYPGLIPLAGPGVNNIFGPLLDKDITYGYQVKGNVLDGIVLKAGEHLALVASNQSGICKYRIGATILHKPQFVYSTGHS